MSVRPRIALCLEYPLALRGGVSVLVEELARGLTPDFEIVIVSPDLNLHQHPLAALGVAHVRWDSSRGFRAASVMLAEQLQRLEVSIAHFHFGGTYGWGIRIPGESPFGTLRRAGTNVCTTIHSALSLLEGYCGPKKPLWFKLALLPLAWIGKLTALRNVWAEIAVSQHDQRRLQKYFWPARTKYRQIYHSRLHAAEPFTELQRTETILCVGHLAQRKGQHILARAFAAIADAHPNWNLEFTGPTSEPSDAEPLEAAIEDGGIRHRVRLHGSCDTPSTLMRTAAIYVQPSLEEGFGLALQEALFWGCASIGSRTGGIPELIEDGRTGLLVPPGDVAALSRALDRMISDATLRNQLAANARQSIFDRGMFSENMIRAHRDLYAQILAQ